MRLKIIIPKLSMLVNSHVKTSSRDLCSPNFATVGKDLKMLGSGRWNRKCMYLAEEWNVGLHGHASGGYRQQVLYDLQDPVVVCLILIILYLEQHAFLKGWKLDESAQKSLCFVFGLLFSFSLCQDRDSQSSFG